MSDLLSLLQQSANALGVYRSVTATTTHNIHNANTPGFARQRANLASATTTDKLGGALIGRGVLLQSVTQARDRFIERQVPRVLAQAAASSTESFALKSVTALDPNGPLPESVGSFFGALRALAQHPGDPGLRQAAVGKAGILAQAFNQTAESLHQSRKGLDSKMTGVVNEVNALSKQMADLNRQIRSATAVGVAPNDLLDARQRVQDRLVTLTGAQTVDNGDSSVNLKLPQGPTLVSGDEAGQLSTLADPNNNGHLVIRIHDVDGSAPTTLNSNAGGELGGLFSARDGALKTALSSLDTLAFDLGDALNSVHSTGFALDGSSGRELFSVGTSASGAASRMQVNTAIVQDASLLAAAGSPSGMSGDASNLQLLISKETQALSGGSDASGALSSLITDFGISAQRIASVAEHDEATSRHITGMRESVSGVSIDEEMINLTRAQRAYEAVTKVIQTTNEMLDTLMKLK